MAGFGDAFVNAYNSAQANNRAEQAAQQQAILFAQAQQDRDEKRANLQKLRDAASDQYKPKSNDVTTYDDPGNATADPTSQIGLGDPGIGVQSPVTAPTPATPPAPTGGLPTNMNLPTPGFVAPNPPALTRAPIKSTDPNPTTSDADGAAPVVVTGKPGSGPPTALAPTPQAFPTDVTPNTPDVTPFKGQRVPVKVDGEVKYVDPQDAEKINNVDRLKNISTELYKQGDVQGAAQAEENSQRIQTGQIELDRAKALQGLQQAYSLTGQAALDARDQQINAMPGGHQTKSTLNADGSITTQDFLNGHLVGTDTVQNDKANKIPAMTILQNRDIATAGDPNKFQDYVTGLSTIQAHGVANAHSQHEDAIADQKLPGELASQKADVRLKNSQAGYYDRLPTGSGSGSDDSSTKWATKIMPDPNTGIPTVARTDPTGKVTQFQVPEIGFVDGSLAQPSTIANYKKTASDNGWDLKAGEDGQLYYINPKTNKASTNAADLTPNKPPKLPDNNGAGRIAKAVVNKAARVGAKVQTAFGRAADAQ